MIPSAQVSSLTTGSVTLPSAKGAFELYQGAFDALSTRTLTSSASEVIFLGIPSGYKHLQIRATVLGSSQNDDVLAQFNSISTTNNYAYHELRGNGAASVTSGSAANTSGFYLATNALDTTVPTVFIMDIHDYASNLKNKTTRVIQGKDSNGGGTVSLFSGLYHGTQNPITSIRIYAASGNFNQYSSFALYGVK
jgi:hypothetical protein